MKTLNEMRQAVKDEQARILTVKAAKQLKGKEIATIYFGYKGQDGVDQFIVGDIISNLDRAKTEPMDGWNNRAEYWESYMTERQIDEQKTQLLLLKNNGEGTYCIAHTKYYNFYQEPTFTASDADREVYFIEIIDTLRKPYLDGRDELYFVAIDKNKSVRLINSDEEEILSKLVGYDIYRYNYWHIDAILVDGKWVLGHFDDIDKLEHEAFKGCR